MALTKPAKVVLCVFAVPVAAWIAASLYFTIAGRDTSGDCICEYLPEPKNLAPEENAYTAIKEFAENIPSNGTTLFCNYRLRCAYLDGTTNRLDLAEEARAALVAESNTIAAVERILAAKGIEISLEASSANQKICNLLIRIANVYKLKAAYEAAQGDLAAGRQSLLDVYRVGSVLQTSGWVVCDHLGGTLCEMSLDFAATPLFAPDDDEAWRAKLRELVLAQLADDKEKAKVEARRGHAVFARTTINDYATNRTVLVGMAVSGPRATLDVMLGKLNSEQLSAERHKGIETRFIAALALTCPGYARYSLQPNRTLDRRRERLEEFCRKIDESGYDVEYANRPAGERKSHLSRNWLGEEISPENGSCGLYSGLFRNRFRSLAYVSVLACRSYKAKHGKYPEALLDLVPEFLAEVPRDPFDGEELRYNATDHFIWTRGEKLAFNGKVEFDANGKPRYKPFSNDSRRVHFLDERPH